MDEFVQEWLDYCEGKLDVDKSHFLGLLSSRPSQEQLQTIFKYIPLKDQIIDNLNKVYEASQEETNQIYLVPRGENRKKECELFETLRHFLN